MAQRITLMIDDSNVEKIREIKLKKMIDTGKGVSLSSVCNEIFTKY